MQGIIRSKYEQLQNALAQLAKMPGREGSTAYMQRPEDCRTELEYRYMEYLKMLAALEQLVIEYEELYAQIKTQFLMKKLKELKREGPPQDPGHVLLLEISSSAMGHNFF